jgi:uncharacterized cupredoxin-like copper-binding protein
MMIIPLAAGALSLFASLVGAPPRIVTVTASDYRFEAPTTIPAGTISFRLYNVGKEIHHLWIVQLAKGKTSADFMAVSKLWGSALRMPPWAIDVGGPNSAAPGQTAEGTMTLEPGQYVLVCWIPSPDGMLHVMKGMVKPLTVVALGATPPSEPTADVTITLDDYAFTLSTPITAGRRTIRFENRAVQSHEAVIGRLNPDRTLMQAVIWMNAGQAGAPPLTPLGGASGLATGRHMYINADFEPGRYVLMCFIPDKKDGKPHSDHGMIKEIVVAR